MEGGAVHKTQLDILQVLRGHPVANRRFDMQDYGSLVNERRSTTVAGPYITDGHRIAVWTRTLRIATKSPGHGSGLERPKSERTGVVGVDEVANPFSYIVTLRWS